MSENISQTFIMSYSQSDSFAEKIPIIAFNANVYCHRVACVICFFTDKKSVLHECFVAHLHIADIYILDSLLSCQSPLNYDDFPILATLFFMLSKQSKYSHGAQCPR